MRIIIIAFFRYRRRQVSRQRLRDKADVRPARAAVSSRL